MKEPRPGAWHRGLWMESSAVGGVPVVFETRETLVLLDGCSGVEPVDLSKRVIEMGWRWKVGWGRLF